MNENRNGQTELELYIHIPFCVRKCGYCDFVSAPAGREVQQAYMERLWEEIEKSVNGETLVSSVFFGGGTPSLIEPLLIEETLNRIRRRFFLSPDAEISMEANPGTLTKEALQIYKRAGVNRLSIGLQSAHNKELSMLGRIHTWEEFLDSFHQARIAGFTNINVDLMSALPGQTVDSWRKTLEKVLKLKPEHISAYSLIIEEGTPFYEQYGEGRHADELPDEDAERQMYVRTREILEGYGYHRYEISNYAKDGYECRHNLGYWDRKEYLGLGAGASSLMDHIRWKEPDYIGPSTGLVLEEREDFTRLRRKDEMEEFMFLGLRKINGVSEQDFYKSFRVTMDEIYQDKIEELIKEGLLVRVEDRIRLTDRGIDLSNYALSQFLLEE